MGVKTLHFAAVLYTDIKWGHRPDKKTGRLDMDMGFEKGKLMAPGARKMCHCFLNDKAFLAVGFDKQISKGIGIVPGVGIPITKRMESGEAHIGFELSDILDYKQMQSLLDGKRFVINTINYIVHIRPVSDKTLDQPFLNRKLINKVHDEYEGLGMKSAGGKGYMAKYDEPFCNWILGAFDYLTQNGHIQKNPGFQLPVCQKHKLTGQYMPDDGAFFCDKCDDYI